MIHQWRERLAEWLERKVGEREFQCLSHKFRQQVRSRHIPDHQIDYILEKQREVSSKLWLAVALPRQ